MWLKLSKAGDEGIRMLWGTEDGPYDPYHIGPATLEAACAAVRAALAELVHVSGTEEPRVRARALRELAVAGWELHHTLFPTKGDVDAAARAKSAKNALVSNFARGDTKLRISGHPEIHVPWALVFESDINQLAQDAGQLEAFGGFWGLKYALSSTLSGYTQPYAKMVRRAPNIRLLSLLNYAEAQTARDRLSEDLRAAYNALIDRPVGVAYDMESCWTLIEKAVSYDTIMHIFSHQSRGKLDLGDAECISITQFDILLGRLAEQSGDTPSYSLVMLNGCDTASGNMDYSFVSTINRPGLCGLIGTEAVVPRDFAALFAIRFLTLMLTEGKSIGESMAELQHEPTLWPLSLLYGCYAQPEYRISS